MARKRERPADEMPASPVAAKLLGEVTQPAAAVQEVVEEPPATPAAPARAPSQEKEPPKKAKARKKKPSRSALAKTYEARVMMSPDERKAAKEAVGALQDVSGTEVTQSHVVRALLTLASRASAAIKANQEHAQVPPRPANNDWRQLAVYEDALADYLLIALRDRLHMDTDE